MLIALTTLVVVIGFIGMIDDIINMPQYIKAFAPILAAVPLIVLRAAGSTVIDIPFIGDVDFGMFYVFLIIPLSITVSANLTNMLAGFNGMESGMAIVIFSTLSLIGFLSSKPYLFVVGLSALGAFAGFFVFNRYPSKVFPGDTGTLVVGALLSALVIVDNFEIIAPILLLPYLIDFVIKAVNGFPSSGWWGKYIDGKLYPLNDKPVGLAQYIMGLFNGISERNLSMFFIAFEFMCGIIALFLSVGI